MNNRSFATSLLFALALGATTLACNKEEEKKELAPQAAELKEEKAAETTMAYEVSTADTKVSFLMDAELEKISGRAPKSTSGTLNVDLKDLSKTSGLVKIDLLELSIFQKKRGSADEEFGEETKNDKQNEHMQTWLQIAGDGPKEELEKNRYAQFKIEKVEAKGNVAEMKGNERKVDITVTGTLRLHERTTKHTFPAEAVFAFEGDRNSGVRVTSKEPLKVSLEAHDVRPRSAFSVLADKTLDALGSKVSKVAEVSLDVSAKAK